MRRAGEGTAARILNDDEGGKALILTAQAVRNPRTNGRKTGDDRTRIPFVTGKSVIEGPALRRVNECQIVHHAADFRKQLRYPLARLAVLLKCIRALHERSGIALAHRNLAFAFEQLAVELLEHRLVVERIYLAHAAAHEQGNYGFRARLEMRSLGKIRGILHVGGGAGLFASWGAEQTILRQQIHQGKAAQTFARLKEKIATGNKTRVIFSSAVAFHSRS